MWLFSGTSWYCQAEEEIGVPKAIRRFSISKAKPTRFWSEELSRICVSGRQFADNISEAKLSEAKPTWFWSKEFDGISLLAVVQEITCMLCCRLSLFSPFFTSVAS